MLKQMSWKKVYELWNQHSIYSFPELNKPLSAEKIHVPCYQRGCYIYGCDWLEKSFAQTRKEILSSDPVNFMFMDASNKGTIQTAEMLLSAKDGEERAAIWIAATAFELTRCCSGSLMEYADMLQRAAHSFLRERYYPWHHAMKKLVPEIMLPRRILKRLTNINAAVALDLIQINTLLLKGNYSILLYSSLEDGETAPNTHNHRKPE